ncbi:MAG: hypothetical protein CMC81_06480 [Flavobacteriaceae bacterium]|nr:hypothetical protein [Flavobacteriaceae bacterium]
MLFVYTPKITPRLGYIFRHIFFRMLDIKIKMTSSIEEFVSHNGPKISYSDKPLGNELFFYRSKILVDTGIQDISPELFNWKGHVVFFKVPENSTLPFDVFGASFYLISRYEEYLPHIKDSTGRFMFKNSLAHQNMFLELPLVDIWISELKIIINKRFNDLSTKMHLKKPFLPILSVPQQFKFLNKSIISSIFQSLQSIYRLDIKLLLRQVLVLAKIKKDPYDQYDFIISFFKKNHIDFLTFFKYSNKSYNIGSVSLLNKNYKLLIKNFSDHNFVGHLVSYFGQLDSIVLKKENRNLQDLIHRIPNKIMLNNGIISLSKIYNDLINNEIFEDYSMCYNDKIGFRASTSVPFYFYDLVNESQTKLKIFPIVSTEESIRKESSSQVFSKLDRIFSFLPLENSIFSIVFTAGIFNKYQENKNLRSSFLKFIIKHGKVR